LISDVHDGKFSVLMRSYRDGIPSVRVGDIRGTRSGTEERWEEAGEGCGGCRGDVGRREAMREERRRGGT